MNARLAIVVVWLLLVASPVVLINMVHSCMPLPYPPVVLWAVVTWLHTAGLGTVCWLIGQREAAKLFACVLIGLPIGVSISLIKT